MKCCQVLIRLQLHCHCAAYIADPGILKRLVESERKLFPSPRIPMVSYAHHCPSGRTSRGLPPTKTAASQSTSSSRTRYGAASKLGRIPCLPKP